MGKHNSAYIGFGKEPKSQYFTVLILEDGDKNLKHSET